MTDEDVIARVAKLFNASYQQWQPKNQAHKTNFLTRLRGMVSADFMRELYPLMSERRKKQIDHALANHVYKADRKGSNNSFVKLNEEKVREIKRQLAQGETVRAIAERFNIGQSTVRDIRYGKTWGHVTVDSTAEIE
jgi:DNA-binding NarL/FixJ family response regulator